MGLYAAKKRFIFIVFFLFIILFSFPPRARSENKTISNKSLIERTEHPLTRNLACYTQCPQSVGRRGALDFDLLSQQLDPHDFKSLFLENGKVHDKASIKEVIVCVKGCRVRTTAKFLARLLGTLSSVDAVRVIGKIMGTVQYKWKGPVSKDEQLKTRGQNTNLGQVVFGSFFRKRATHILRHMPEELERFNKNIAILRQVYYEIYGIEESMRAQ